jgi:hypothetical protein
MNSCESPLLAYGNLATALDDGLQNIMSVAENVAAAFRRQRF